MQLRQFALVFSMTSSLLALTSHSTTAFTIKGPFGQYVSSQTSRYPSGSPIGAVVLSHVPYGLAAHRGVEIGRVANLTSSESSDGNAVEVGGIRFETLVPERVLIIPVNQPGVSTFVQFGIRITNKTQKPIRFGLYNSLFLQIVGENGTPEFGNITTDAFMAPTEEAFPIVQPGQSITSFVKGKLFWQNNKLIISAFSDFGYHFVFAGLKPGKYHVMCRYDNKQDSGVFLLFPTVERLNDGTVLVRDIPKKLFEGKAWTGEVSARWEEFRLVMP